MEGSIEELSAYRFENAMDDLASESMAQAQIHWAEMIIGLVRKYIENEQ